MRTFWLAISMLVSATTPSMAQAPDDTSAATQSALLPPAPAGITSKDVETVTRAAREHRGEIDYNAVEHSKKSLAASAGFGLGNWSSSRGWDPKSGLAIVMALGVGKRVSTRWAFLIRGNLILPTVDKYGTEGGVAAEARWSLSFFEIGLGVGPVIQEDDAELGVVIHAGLRFDRTLTLGWQFNTSGHEASTHAVMLGTRDAGWSL
jgi:hypothetical protein